MLSKQDIIRAVNDDDNFVDSFILDAFIKNWKIEAIYEDENGVEYYDDLALAKIKSALMSKQEDEKEFYSIENISNDFDNAETEEHIVEQPIEAKEVTVVQQELVDISQGENSIEPKSLTLDITNQTLAVLAQSIAEKITGDISGYLKKNEWLEEAFEAGTYKKDNEILASKFKELLDDNKILIQKIKELESDMASYQKVFGNVYVKKNNNR